MTDGIKYALLVSVGKYDMEDITDLPTYKEDIKLMSESLINGLGFLSENIRSVGEDGKVNVQSFTYAIKNFKQSLNENDTFVMYYSGHGLDNTLYFTDTLVELKSIIRVVDSLPAKRKWIILDCCHSGAAKTPDTKIIPRIIDLKLADYIDQGTTIMASSGIEQMASFDVNHSLYTGMLCQAIMSDSTTRHGRKSLWDINNMVQYMMDEWNSSHAEKIQYPIFRSSEIGTISFVVNKDINSSMDSMQDNKPLFVTDDYIITSAKSLSTANVKRNCAFVMMKCDKTEENIIRVTNEVVNLVKGLNLDSKHAGYVAKVVWCYFGADTTDMIKSNYFSYTISTDDAEQKRIHFRENKQAHIVNNIYIFENSTYELIRKMNQPNTSPEEYLKSLNITISDIVNMGEMFVRDITEVYNRTMDIETFRNAYSSWIKKVKKDYIEISDMSSPPDMIYDYSEKIMELAGWLVDLGIYVDGDKELKPIDHWVIKNAIRRYHESIESITIMQKYID